MLDAEVVPVKQEQVYTWKSENFNIGDESFQKQMADELLGVSYDIDAQCKRGSNYIGDSGVLSLIRILTSPAIGLLRRLS